MKRIIIATSGCPGTGLTTFGNNAVSYLGKENACLLDFSDYLSSRPESSLLGGAFREASARGEKVDDDIIVPHIASRLARFLADKKEQILFVVGIPRTIRQAVSLVTELRRIDGSISIEHIFFELETIVCRERMKARCRPGETDYIINKRINEFGADMVSTNDSLVKSCDRRFEFLADNLINDYPAALQLLGLVDDSFSVLPRVA